MKTEDSTDVKKEKEENQPDQNKEIDIRQRFSSIPKWEAVRDVDDGEWDF